MSFFEFHTVEKFLTLQLPHPTWAVEKMIPGEGWTLLVAPGKTGKSIFMTQVATALGKGEGTILGCPVLKPWRVLYVQADAPAGTWQEQMSMLEAAPPSHFTLTMAKHGFLDAQDARHELRKVITEQFDFVIFDALDKLSNDKDINDKSEAMTVIKYLRDVTDGKPFTLIHHPRKPSPDALPDDPRHAGAGSRYFSADANGILELWTKGPQGRLSIVSRLAPDRQILCNRGPNGEWLLGSGVVKKPTPPTGDGATVTWKTLPMP